MSALPWRKDRVVDIRDGLVAGTFVARRGGVMRDVSVELSTEHICHWPSIDE